MLDKKTDLAYTYEQSILPKSLRKKEQRMLALFEDHLSEIHRSRKKMQYSTKRSISTLIN